MDQIASVASFFLSRIDTKADALLDAGSPLRGELAIASARVAYQRGQARFGGAGWQRLAGLGARPQRLLWASTRDQEPRSATPITGCSTASPASSPPAPPLGNPPPQRNGNAAPCSASGRGPWMRRSAGSMGTSLMLASRRRIRPS